MRAIAVQVGYRVEPSPMIRMTSKNTLEAEPQPGQDTVPLDSLERVLRARWIVDAGRALQRREESTIEAQQERNDLLHCGRYWAVSRASSRRTSSTEEATIGLRATRTYATSGMRPGETERNASFMRRLARLRSTDSPTLREAVNPTAWVRAGDTKTTINAP